LRFVRAHQADAGSGINTLYKFHDKVEALEFTVGDNFEFEGVSVKDLRIKRDVLLGGIVRDGQFILPKGESSLIKGDKVIVVAGSRQINGLTEIFR
jgi:trk system potassium uptake protein TrkA